MRRVLVPPAPGVFSALGLLFSDTEHEVVRTLMLRGPELTPERLGSAFGELETEARAHLTRNGNAPATVSRYADVRFAGQAYELSVPVPAGVVDVAVLVADFVAEHVRTYGHGSADDPVDVVSVRALARLERTAAQRYDPLAAIQAMPTVEGSRRAYFGPETGLVETPACNRSGLLGARRHGPLLVDEPDSTCVVPPGWVASLDDHGNIEVELGG
jgi:N-methylhydantoinase A